MFKRIGISKSYYLITVAVLASCFTGVGFFWVPRQYDRLFAVSLLVIILAAVMYLSRHFSTRVRKEFDSVTAFFKLGAMMSVNTSKRTDLNGESLSLHEFRVFAE